MKLNPFDLDAEEEPAKKSGAISGGHAKARSKDANGNVAGMYKAIIKMSAENV